MNLQSLISKQTFGFFILGVLTSVGLWNISNFHFSGEVLPGHVGPFEETGSSSVPVGPIMSLSNPVRLSIPSLNISTNFTKPLGLNSNGEVDVPDTYTEVGWYKFSPTPGEIGPAVVLGHVDSYTGPAIFYSLGQLKPGDDIFIDREDGSTAHFQVSYFERYDQSEFPTEKVYGNINYAGLRLITCTGTFNKGKQRYSHNLVVYAKLVE